MSTAKKSKKLTKNQLQAILNTEHIRQHLISVGLINNQGKIISKDEYQRRSRQQQNKEKYPTSARPVTIAPTSGRSNTKEIDQSQSSDQRVAHTSTDQPKQTNKSQISARSSSSNRSTCVQNVLLRRAVSPKTVAAGDRCIVMIKYFGAELDVEYDREWFEPNGDEIVVMQQHCGGENRLVFKGFLKPDDVFSFESLRHADYPFALACYINGVIYNRLSLCCESRCKGFMRIGGRHGVFGIMDVQKAKPCRRCRYEERMKKLMENEGKSSTANNKRSRERSTKSSRLRSKSPASRSTSSVSTTTSKNNPPSKTAGVKSSTSTANDQSISGSNIPPAINVKSTAAHTSNPEPTKSGTPSPKPHISHKPNTKTMAVPVSDDESIKSDMGSIDLPVSHKPNSKSVTTHQSSSKQTAAGMSSPRSVSSLDEPHESSTSPKHMSNHQPKTNSSSNRFSSNLQKTDGKNHSNSRNNKQTASDSSNASENRHHQSTTSAKWQDDETDSESEQMVSERNHRINTAH